MEMKKAGCWIALAVVLGCTACAAPSGAAAGSATGAASGSSTDVRQVVDQWLDSLQGGVYRATLQARDGSPLPVQAVNERLFAWRDGDIAIGIGFDEPPTPQSTLQSLRASFRHLALDHIPVPGVPRGQWDVHLQTPVSSFSEGVSLESWESGVLRLRVQTRFFAAYGRRMGVHVPADAPMPEGSYFQIRKPVKADLVIEGRLF